MKYLVYYKNADAMSVWRLNGLYTKTDALGTAGLCLKNGYQVKIVPFCDRKKKNNQEIMI